jgi:hypothetical protein
MPRGRPSLALRLRSLKNGSGASAPEDVGTGSESIGGASGDSGPEGDIGGAAGTDPDSGIASRDGESAPKRKRGRPPGSGGSGSPQKKIPLNVSGVEKLLLGIYSGVATFTSNPEIELNEAQAKAYAGAIADVAKHYPDLPMVDPKWQAWGALAFVGFMIHKPMVTAVVARKKREAHEAKFGKPKQPEAVVTVSSGAMPEGKSPASRQDRDASGFSFMPDFSEDLAA